MSIASNIAALRARRKLTAAALAERVGVSEETVTRWESGEAEPEIGALKKIAGALGTDAAALLSDPPPPGERKKDVTKLAVACALALVLGVAAILLSPVAAMTRERYYILAPMILLSLFLLPAFWLTVGWGGLHGAAMAGLMRPVRARFTKAVRIAVAVLVALYAALMLPLLVDQALYWADFLRFRQNPALYGDSLQYVPHIPDFLITIEWRVMNAVYRLPAVFLVPGAVFRLMRPAKPRSGGADNPG